uniref:Perlustrin-like protein n=1 Tax=Crassostrea virginica TaxID=6565 RepID=A0A8B8B3K6_CRAVI|nr:perlustrin-like protein [Crassostrea virginica]
MDNHFMFPLFVMGVFGVVAALKCTPCDRFVQCPELPSNTKDCEVVQRPCHCCKECARRVGEHCSWATARCASGLMCVNDEGEALVSVPPFLTYFKGTCQFVVIQPIVVENTEVRERRHRV